MIGSGKERVTVDLTPEQKKKLRLISALLDVKSMQQTMVRLIEDKYDTMNIGTISQKAPDNVPSFKDEEMRDFQA